MKEHMVAFPGGERPDTVVHMGCVVILAIAFNLAFFALISTLRGTFIRDLFIGRYEVDPARLGFQFLTMYMFALSIMTVLLKRLKVRRELNALRTIPLPDDLDMNDASRLKAIYESVTRMPASRKRMAPSRVARVLAMWINSGDFERTMQYARENSEADVFASDTSFRANRLFIWAMPLLGFLGTVYGVSYGIGGFAAFLRGETISPEDMLIQVGMITQGLAVAFYTTLVGLVTAGLSAFPNMVAERREEQLLAEIDLFIEERLTARMPSVGQKEFPSESIEAMRQDIGRVADALCMPIRELVSSIEEGFRRLPSPARYQEVFAEAIARAGDLLNEKYGRFMTSYEAHVDELGALLAGRLADVSNEFRASTKTMADQLTVQARAVESGCARAVEQQAATASRYVQMLEQAGDRESLRWKEVSDSIGRRVDDTGNQLTEAASALAESSSRAARTADETARTLANQMQRVLDVGTSIENLLQATRSIEKALDGIAAGEEFQLALSDIRNHLQATDELVERLTKPRQIVLTESY